MRAAAKAAAVAAACLSGFSGSAQAAHARAPRFAVSNTAAAHRILLPSGAAAVRFSPLEARLEIFARDGLPLSLAGDGFAPTPCKPAGKGAFACSTALLDAALVELGPRHYLDLRELRGLPTAAGDEEGTLLSWPPEQLGLGSACPGDTEAARGECAFEAGALDQAEQHLGRAAQAEGTRRFAALRLGDIALRRGEADAGLAFYRAAAGDGPFGRIATARIAELTGLGLFQARLDVYDATSLPEPLRAELELRELRALALLRRWPEALYLLGTLAETACAQAPHSLCHRVALAALRAPAAPHELSLEAYLYLPTRTRGPLAAALAEAAAAAAGELGAPAFGATLLSSTVRETARAAQAAHLRQAFELYLQAGDPVRAQVIADYAQAHARADDAPWGVPTAQSQQAAPVSEADPLPGDSAEALLAIARSTLLRARLVAVGGRR